jgi:hypothetical protein
MNASIGHCRTFASGAFAGFDSGVGGRYPVSSVFLDVLEGFVVLQWMSRWFG